MSISYNGNHYSTNTSQNRKCIKLVTVDEGNQKTPFSIATRRKCIHIAESVSFFFLNHIQLYFCLIFIPNRIWQPLKRHDITKHIVKVKLATLIEGDPKAPFSIATTPRCRRGCYSFPGLLHFTLDPYLIVLSVKQGVIKYHFLSLWYDST